MRARTCTARGKYEQSGVSKERAKKVSALRASLLTPKGVSTSKKVRATGVSKEATCTPRASKKQEGGS